MSFLFVVVGRIANRCGYQSFAASGNLLFQRKLITQRRSPALLTHHRRCSSLLYPVVQQALVNPNEICPNRVFQQTQRSVGNHSLRLELSFSSVLHFTGNRCEIARQFERVVAWRESLKYKHTVKPNGLRKSVAWEVT